MKVVMLTYFTCVHLYAINFKIIWIFYQTDTKIILVFPIYFIIQRALKDSFCLLEQLGKGGFRPWKIMIAGLRIVFNFSNSWGKIKGS